MDKITKIEINEDCAITELPNGANLIGLIITTKNSIFSNSKTYKVYPSSIGRKNSDNGDVMFYYFCDELGERLDNDLSIQLNNYCSIQDQLLKFE
jgi:hypothetical protein